MKGRTLVRIGTIWLVVIVTVLGPFFLLPFVANEFAGLGVELPFPVSWFGLKAGIVIFRFLGYLLLLGWVPFLLFGIVQTRRERKRPFIDNPSLNS